MTIDRRSMIALGLGSVFLGGARRSMSPAAGRRLSIDANLVPPIEGPGRLSPRAIAILRGARLTALRVNVDGDGTAASTAEAIDVVSAAIGANAGLLRHVRTIADIEASRRDGRLGFIFGFEQTGQFGGQVDAITRYAAQGVRIMQLSYNQGSPFGSGVLSAAPTGLTASGREAVARMKAGGVTIDLSHSDERTTLDVLAVTAAPAAITHAGCAAITPHPRNKSDAVLRAMAEGGGAVGLYELPFLAQPPKQPDIDDYLAHVLHALRICGEDHVAIGSDAMMAPFDASPANMRGYLALVAKRRAQGIGAPGEDRPPFVTGLNRPDRIEIVARALGRRDVPARVVDKIAGGNWLRVFRDTWA